MSRIRVLPDHLINQIAAGEVIERPASVVKELLENAVDAGATSIVIDIEGGGRRRIRVADDGEGLGSDDILLALERHATSKLGAASDLGRIVTLGFRGEALPAIASVSRLTVTSCRDGGGTRVDVEAGRILQVAPAGHPQGTTMDVRDLFFNTPARAKFLKSPQTELGHISDLVAACSIAIPAIAVTLSHESRRLVEATAGGDQAERIRQVFGPEWGEALCFRSSIGAYEVRGFLLPPSAAASTRRSQHLYVNGRLVRDRLVNHAIMSACQAFLPKDRHVAVFLFIECEPEAVDVNVHPAKAEVRFADSRAVHDLVRDAIGGALRGEMPITALGIGASGRSSEAFELLAVREGPSQYTPRSMGETAPTTTPVPAAGTPVLPAMGDIATVLAHYRESYIVAADRDGLLIIDQHAAHERILYEKLVRQSLDDGAGQQELLFPFAARLPRRLAPLISDVVEELGRLGLGAEPFGEETLKITRAPAILDAPSLPGLVDDLLRQMEGAESVGGGAGLPRMEKSLATVACHAAIKVRMPLTLEKMNYLIKELFRTENPLKCPHGRPTVLQFSQLAIERGFDRR
ncbi:MAG TPA: DNA mismatch repair endonuclease MutL [Patescibacteria group bacterium]|nr:DNA mismatch repair endonuclease MutL [Patescibacteria group bacterium]